MQSWLTCAGGSFSSKVPPLGSERTAIRFRPGTKQLRSDLGLMVAGFVVEAVTGADLVVFAVPVLAMGEAARAAGASTMAGVSITESLIAQSPMS